MPTLVVETGAGLSNANSYVSLAEVDTYFDEHLYGDEWTALVGDDRTRAAIQSTRLIDSYLVPNGSPTVSTQALLFPRSGAYTRDGVAIDSDEIPQRLKYAVCEMCRFVAAGDRSAESTTRGITSASAGSLSVEFDKYDQPGVLPDVVSQMLMEFGYLVGQQGMIGIVRLERG